MSLETRYAYPCRRGCGKPATEGKSCCSQVCRDKMQNCNESGCTNAVEPITYQGHDYAGFTEKCYKHGGRHNFEGEIIHGKSRKVLFVKTVRGWIRSE